MDTQNWPWPAETQTLRARRVAAAYREQLLRVSPEVCAAIDGAMRTYGQQWLFDVTDPYQDDDLISGDQAAEILAVSPDAVRKLRSRGKLAGIPDRNGWRYVAADVRALRVAKRARSSVLA